MIEELPQRDHAGDCTGTCYRTHKTLFAYNTHSRGRRDAPGRTRFRRRRRRDPDATLILPIPPTPKREESDRGRETQKP